MNYRHFQFAYRHATRGAGSGRKNRQGSIERLTAFVRLAGAVWKALRGR